MKSIRKIVLGLATMTMLASCAKQITKAEAIEIAKAIETANVIYKSGSVQMTTTISFSNNFPEALKTQYNNNAGTKTNEFKSQEEVLAQRISVMYIEPLDEKENIFRADGRALELEYNSSTSGEGGSTKITSSSKYDVNGYPTAAVANTVLTMLVSGGETYTITAKVDAKYSWVK